MIERYYAFEHIDGGIGYDQDPEGYWVKYADHKAEVEQAEARISELTNASLCRGFFIQHKGLASEYKEYLHANGMKE